VRFHVPLGCDARRGLTSASGMRGLVFWRIGFGLVFSSHSYASRRGSASSRTSSDFKFHL
jgi:hypothetical protein